MTKWLRLIVGQFRSRQTHVDASRRFTALVEAGETDEDTAHGLGRWRGSERDCSNAEVNSFRQGVNQAIPSGGEAEYDKTN
jgi:hypothetical protein